MDLTYSLAVLFFLFVDVVSGKHCTYIYENGYMKYFFCNTYEYCCGAMCCRSQVVTFYQVWYFWLIIFLTLMLCSGGSWFYKFHNRGAFPSSMTGGTQPTGLPRPVIQPAAFTYGAGVTQQPYYPQVPQPMAHPPPQQMMHPTLPQPMMHPTPAPPPYYEPPPSYTAATANRPS